MKIRYCLPLFLAGFWLNAQINSTYEISFTNAVHHEAEIRINFKNIENDTAVFRMPRSSPGRYAIHEFAKNVYNVKVRDADGEELELFRTNPYSWKVPKHNGELYVSYTIFANHGDGTYSQIDETHAHLNMPATFMFMEELANDEFKITFNKREDLNWKIATQLKPLDENSYYAKDLQYFMDSPTELSNHRTKSFTVEGNGKGQSIKFVLHDDEASDDNFSSFFSNVEKIVYEQKAIYGELPDFDYGEYLFLACYMPQVTGDGMEHRNSTILTTTRSISGEGAARNLGTVAHEFFHCWNVERIRPESLEPFDFTEANMTDALWFAEGFTSYYDGLSMKRAGILNQEEYLRSIKSSFNFVWNSPGREIFSPIEMSYQAPFVDAARSVDETNRENTFISYYSYGDMLGLALDIMLRNRGANLDQYMQLIWEKYGKNQIPYTIRDLQDVLADISDKEFADHYFNSFIYDGKMPQLTEGFKNVGVLLTTEETVNMGAFIRNNKLTSNPRIGSTFYNLQLQKGDEIVKLNGEDIGENTNINDLIESFKVGDKISLKIERYNNEMLLSGNILPITQYKLQFIPDENLTKEQIKNKADWLESKI